MDPANGDDSRGGATRGRALRTISAAWESIPVSITLTTTGYRIMLARGEYAESTLPNYLELRFGTMQFPVILQAADGSGTAILRGDLNIANSRYIVQIRGNIIWNGPPAHPLGIEDFAQGCQDTNPSCTAAQLRADNAINTVEPQFADLSCGNFRPRLGGTVFDVATFALPSFPGGDRPAPPLSPQGTLENLVATDRDGQPRASTSPPGVYAGATAAGCTRLPLVRR